MGEILFLAHRMPWPPDRGDKIRSHHLLKHLTGLAPVHVATFGENAQDMAHEGDLAAIVESYCLVRRTKNTVLAGTEALLSRKPVSLTAFHDGQIAQYVTKLLASGRISTIFAFSSQMAQYVPADFAGQFIMDFVDVDSAKFESYAQKAAFPMKRIYAREADLLAKFEAQVGEQADISLLVSEAEAELFKERTGLQNPRIRALTNGINARFFDPRLVESAPQMAQENAINIVFTGQMDYLPNIEAVTWFSQEVMPLIAAQTPHAHFWIVGRAPTATVQALDGRNQTHVTGEVDDVRCWLKGADMVVAPLQIARGVQNKVLEAMAMEKPVICTSAAATGIGAEPGTHFLLADSDHGFVNQVAHLIRNRKQARALAISARRYVQDERSWPAVLAPLSQWLGRDEGTAKRGLHRGPA